jgi:hypothetical protein
MKKVFLLILLMIFSLSASYGAAGMKYGSLNVFSKISSTKIYVDGEMKGFESVQIKEIQAGTHFVKVTTVTSPETIVYADVVDIAPGEVTTVYVTDNSAEETKRAEAKQDITDVYKAKRVLDYSKETHMGWYLKTGYLTNMYYNLDSPSLDNYSSTLAVGLGVKVPLAPNIDFSIEMERASFVSTHTMWTFTPITANIQMSYLPSPYFRGKQYFGLGLGYYMTDLETQYKQNLTAMGYHLFYGLEMPSGDKNAIFFEFGYQVADMTRYNYVLNAIYATAGYRFDVME